MNPKPHSLEIAMNHTPSNPESVSTVRRGLLSGLGAAAAAGAALAAPGLARAAGAPAGIGSASRVLEGKSAIVTGARNNMGRAFAVALGGMGAGVVVHHHRVASRDEAEETARMVRAAGGKAVVVHGDLGETSNVRRLYDLAHQQYGGIDIVVNNAGMIVKKPVAQFTEDEFDRLHRINTRALFFSMQEASRRMRNNGRIINIGTSLQAGSAPGYAAYGGTKAPVEEFSRMMAREVGSRGITVNTVAPGPIDTPFFHSQETPESTAFAARLAVAGRLGRVDEIVPMVTFLAGPESQWVNGQTLFVNGGYLTR
jgi:NAD(P)-dependent dehydrogenase (short-subunit alcohol dehydrogenase family)